MRQNQENYKLPQHYYMGFYIHSCPKMKYKTILQSTKGCMYLFELVLFFWKTLRSGIVRLYDGIIRWRSRSMCARLLLQELQNYNSLLNNHRQEKVGSHQKKDTLCQRAKEKPQKDGRRGKIVFRIKIQTCQRHSENSNKPCAHQDPETPQRLRQNCV